VNAGEAFASTLQQWNSADEAQHDDGKDHRMRMIGIDPHRRPAISATRACATSFLQSSRMAVVPSLSAQAESLQVAAVADRRACRP
jgi:hypothetical protein